MGVPGNANALLLRSAAAAGGYQVSRSLRFNSADSAYLSRTPASAGNRKTWTWSGWVKRCATSPQTGLFAAGVDASNISVIYLASNGPIYYYDYVGGSMSTQLISSAVFRDFSGWMHIQVAVDTTQATAANRVRLYVNGLEITAFSTAIYPTQNADTFINTASTHTINKESDFYANYGNFYLAECHFVDGQQLAPSSFTEVSATTGQLIPKAYTGSFGTNGFWLKFSDNSAATATTLGKDYSGNGNNWTPNNLSVTAGAGNDSLVDTPTSYGTDTGAGGEVRGNYATLNAIAGTGTLANGNLEITSSGQAGRVSTIGLRSGKWYWETAIGSTPVNTYVGLCEDPNNVLTGYAVSGTAGNRYSTTGGTFAVTDGNFQTGDVFGIAADLDAGTVTWYRNGSIAVTLTGATLNSKPWYPGIIYNGAASTPAVFNFGQRPFAYTAPSGFKALCDTNLPAPVVAKPNTVFDVVKYIGNGTAQTVSGLNFSPDFLWGKNRSSAFYHILVDSIRGATARLFSNTTDAESVFANSFTAFTSNGFSVGSASDVNNNNDAIVTWCWDAGSSTVTNTQGSITSSVRANQSAGFSVITYTGNGSSTATFGHGLNVAPGFFIIKNRSSSCNWMGYHSATGKDAYYDFNTTNVVQTTIPNIWGTSGPSSSLITVPGAYLLNNQNGQNYVCYAWAPVTGYSSFGSYTGNGSSDGPFVYTGFRPRWVMVKASSSVSYGSWRIYDSARGSYNVIQQELYANLSNSEDASNTIVDFLSNGFKLRSGAIDGYNGSGATIIYAAFAESPFQYARAR